MLIFPINFRAKQTALAKKATAFQGCGINECVCVHNTPQRYGWLVLEWDQAHARQIERQNISFKVVSHGQFINWRGYAWDEWKRGVALSCLYRTPQLFTLEQAKNAQRRSKVKLYSFLKLGARWGGRWSTPRPGRFTPGKGLVPIAWDIVSQLPGRGPMPGPGIIYIGPRDILLEFVILVF